MTAELDPRTMAQLAFLVDADRLKSVLRANPLVDGSRRENTAEHRSQVAHRLATCGSMGRAPSRPRRLRRRARPGTSTW